MRLLHYGQRLPNWAWSHLNWTFWELLTNSKCSNWTGKIWRTLNVPSYLVFAKAWTEFLFTHVYTWEQFLCQNTSTSSVFVDITNINRKRLFFHSRKLRFVPTNNASFPLRSLKKVASIWRLLGGKAASEAELRGGYVLLFLAWFFVVNALRENWKGNDCLQCEAVFPL